jgi:hypothetical protein
VLTIEGQKADKDIFTTILKTKKAGDTVQLTVIIGDKPINFSIVLVTKKEKTFKIEQMPNSTSFQKSIVASWLK